MFRAESSGKNSQETIGKHENRNPQEPHTGYTEVTQNGSEILMLNHSFQEESLSSTNGQKLLNMIQKARPKNQTKKKT